MKFAIAAVGILVGLTAGYFTFGDLNSNDQIELDSAQKIKGLERQLGEAETQLATAKSRAGRLESTQKMHRSDLTAALLKIEDLEKSIKNRQELTEQPVAVVDGVKNAADHAKRLKIAKLNASKFAKVKYGALLNPKEFNELVNELKALGEEGVDMALEMLAGDNDEEKILAANLLGVLDDPRAAGALADAAIEAKNPEIAAWASQSLMKTESDGAVEALKHTIESSPHEGARVNSMWGLCRHGDESGINMAREYLKNDKNSLAMRNALEGSLFLIDQPSLRPLIDDLLARSNNNNRAAVMGQAISWYGRNADDVNRQRLSAAANNNELSEALRQQARDILSSL